MEYSFCFVILHTEVFNFRNAAGYLLGFAKQLDQNETRQKKQKLEKTVQQAELNEENETTEDSSEEDEADDVDSKKRKLETESESSTDEDEKVVNNVKNSKKKQKIETETTESDSEQDEEVKNVKTSGKKRKLDTETTEQSNTKKKSKKEKVDISFPSMANFFEVDDDNKKEDESSDDDGASVETSKKKKKLTAAERAELARKEEERLRQIENELADPSKAPESAEQFERLALANPNSSKIWTQYIAFHLSVRNFCFVFKAHIHFEMFQTAEVEKARIVVKRALESIEIEKIQDKLNIWVAYLNLENMFGTKVN